MTRATGFIAFAAAIAAAVAFVVLASLNRMPEPFAACVEAHRDRPEYGLGTLHDTDLVLDETASGVEEGERAGTRYRIIRTRVAPVSRAAGQGVTVTCYEIAGRDGLLLDEASLPRTSDAEGPG